MSTCAQGIAASLAGLAAVERRLLLAWRTLPHSPATDRLAIGLSRFGDHAHGWIAIGVAGAVCDRRRASRWLTAAATAAMAERASRQIKKVVRRTRPEIEGLPPLAGVTARYSFPSSHTATAVAALYTFEGLLPRPVLVGWALLTAASRPYLGVHYPSDVAFGVLLGYGTAKVVAPLSGHCSATALPRS